MHEHRLNQTRELLTKYSLDAILVSKPASLFYLLGFTGSHGLGYISGRTVLFLTDFRYKEQAADEVRADEIILATGSLTGKLAERQCLAECRRLGFEDDHISFRIYQELSDATGQAELVPLAGDLETMAARKSSEEVSLIESACTITLKVFENLIPKISEGVTEADIAAEISYMIKKQGGEGDAFEPIVLFGSNSARPHGKPGAQHLHCGDTILLDFGAKFQGYHADFSRVLVCGTPDPEIKNVHGIVSDALMCALEAIKPGKPARDIDAAARSIIGEGGYAECFGHAVGHGLGIEIHSSPRISPTNDEAVLPGNVFTIEPGIYIPGRFGVRLENVVSVEQSGKRILTDFPLDIVSV